MYQILKGLLIMAQIINGRLAYKVGLHIHTTRSDGKLPYEEVVSLYKANGYDAVAVTDHWVWNDSEHINGIPVISGAEFNIGGNDASGVGVYHILGIGCVENPGCDKTDPPQTLIDKIHAKDGIAILAHPAWSLNTPEQILALDGIDMTEIYNTVSAVHESDRPYSGLIIDMIASRGMIIPIHAADDSHYYDGTDSCVAYVWVYADSDSVEDIKKALLAGDFYSTMGPDIDLKLVDGELIVKTSPVNKIAVHSNIVWANEHVSRGEDITSKHYTPMAGETFLRVEATDAEGKTAWSNIISLS